MARPPFLLLPIRCAACFRSDLRRLSQGRTINMPLHVRSVTSHPLRRKGLRPGQWNWRAIAHAKGAIAASPVMSHPPLPWYSTRDIFHGFFIYPFLLLGTSTFTCSKKLRRPTYSNFRCATTDSFQHGGTSVLCGTEEHPYKQTNNITSTALLTAGC